MTRTIFISHSADDKQILRFYLSAFDDTNIKPVTMEYEKWSRNNEPNWQWIKKQVKHSKALFVILTKSVITKVQTQNWISFEIGIAAGSFPQIPVFVFMEEEVNFPVPYLNHFFPKPFTLSPEEMKKMDIKELLLKSDAKSQLRTFIKNPHILFEDKTFRCTTCLTIFSYWDNEKPYFPCPCCRSTIFSGLSKYHLPKTNKES